MTNTILSSLSFFVFSKNSRRFFYIEDYYKKYNVAKLVTVSKQQIIKSYLIQKIVTI